MGVESVVVAPKDEQASRHIEAVDRSIEVDFEEANGIPTDQLPAILEQAGADPPREAPRAILLASGSEVSFSRSWVRHSVPKNRRMA